MRFWRIRSNILQLLDVNQICNTHTEDLDAGCLGEISLNDSLISFYVCFTVCYDDDHVRDIRACAICWREEFCSSSSQRCCYVGLTTIDLKVSNCLVDLIFGCILVEVESDRRRVAKLLNSHVSQVHINGKGIYQSGCKCQIGIPICIAVSTCYNARGLVQDNQNVSNCRTRNIPSLSWTTQHTREQRHF
jgi:hypothetical protein